MKIDDVSFFGIKDYTGNLQSIYAIQTSNAIYTIKSRRIVRIQSMNETLVFNYENNDTQYKVLLVSQNSSYEVPTTYQNPNVTFPTPVFEFPQDETPPKIFTGVLVEFSNKITGRSIEDATLLMNYFDAKDGNKSSIMLNFGGGRYYSPLSTNDTTFDKFFDMKKLLSTIALQSDACLQLFQAYPIDDICSKAPDSTKSLCARITEEMTVTIPDALRKASQYTALLPLQSQLFGSVSDIELVAYVPGEDSLRIFLNATNQINTTERTASARNMNSVNPNNLNTFSVRAGGARGQCNEQTVAGGDIPDDRLIDIGKSRTTVKFSYETYTVKDQIDVYYMGRQVFSSGCVGANGATSISLDDNESTLRVNVIPNCAGETGTAWFYSLECSGNELICEDNLCYCGLARGKSEKIKDAKFNGCGGEGSDLNFLIQPIGALWGFTPACNDHDLCYGTCNNLRDRCDGNFLTSMQLNCIKFLLVPELYPHCTIWADIYYLAVHFAGPDFFIPGQKENCQCPSNRRRRDVYYYNTTLVK